MEDGNDLCETQRAHRKGSNFWWTVELGRLHTISTRTSGNGRLQNMPLDSGRLGWLIVVFVSLETVVVRLLRSLQGSQICNKIEMLEMAL
jgi:hypothetical protein